MAGILVLLAGCGGGPRMRVVEGPKIRKPVAGTKGPTRELTHGGQINLSLAQNYLQAGELSMALDRAHRALATDPGSGSVHAMLGLINDRIGNQARASQSFQRAIQLSPNGGGVLNAYGTWLCSHGDYAGAAQQFARALNDPFFTARGLAHFNAGHCLLKSGQAVQAEVSLRRSLDEPGSDLASVLMSLAQATLAQGKLLEARGFIQRRESMGVTPEVLELAARIEDASGDRAAAARYRARLQPGGANGEGQP
ncbi:MAG TPA: type IV pilus biogenesis/stability protein PilW [Ramlibacter sp.]|nr:type IV pilus biogenesis/stability protein PilW [Ramlibacter sp.]